MSDPLTPLFDDLRRRTLPEVQAPGAEAARRTVHRRATVRASALAAVAIAAFGSYVVTQRDNGGAVLPAASASASAPALPGRPDKAEVAAALVPGADHADVVMGEYSQDVGYNASSGNWLLRVGCSGPSPLAITILLDGAVEQQNSVPCTDDGTVRDYVFTMPRDGSIRILVGGGLHDAYALKLTER
ncbi:MAG: hypothetical protein SYR96_35685 [Actinomycetota bacterium]|nr:hypothetical protein [Actinomycetota bacterium]